MYDDARAFSRRTPELAPNMLEGWWETGRTFYLGGRSDEAREAWRTGLEVNRGRAPAHSA